MSLIFLSNETKGKNCESITLSNNVFFFIHEKFNMQAEEESHPYFFKGGNKICNTLSFSDIKNAPDDFELFFSLFFKKKNNTLPRITEFLGKILLNQERYTSKNNAKMLFLCYLTISVDSR